MKLPEEYEKLRKWATECSMKKAAQDIYKEQNNSNASRYKGKQIRGQHTSQKPKWNFGGRKNFKPNTKRPFD